MAYKQPKNTPMHNDGASEPITAALIALGTKLGGAIKAIGAGGKVLGTGGKVLAKGGGKKLALTAKEKALAKSLKKAGRQSVRQAKRSMSLGEKVKNVGMQAENIARKGADKLSKATGQSFDKSLEFVKDKAVGATSQAVSKGVSKLQQSSELEEPQSGVKTTPLHGYSNPEGPNMFAHRQGPTMGVGVKYDNDGASQVPQKLKSTPQKQVNGKFASLNKGNIQLKNKGLPQYFLNNFSAPISIGGVQVDAGDVIRGLYTGGKMIQEKRLKNIEDRKIDAKNKSAQQKKQEQMTAKIMKDIDNPIDNIL